MRIDVAWTVSGNTSSSTVMDASTLKVAAEEKAKTLEVSATTDSEFSAVFPTSLWDLSTAMVTVTQSEKPPAPGPTPDEPGSDSGTGTDAGDDKPSAAPGDEAADESGPNGAGSSGSGEGTGADGSDSLAQTNDKPLVPIATLIALTGAAVIAALVSWLALRTKKRHHMREF